MTTVDRKEKLKKLQSAYIVKLDDRFAAVKAAVAQVMAQDLALEPLNELHRLLHNLNGSSGTYGLHSLSMKAKSLESSIATMEERGAIDEDAWQSFLQGIDALGEVIDTVKRIGSDVIPRPEISRIPSASPLVHIIEDDVEQAEFSRRVLLDNNYRVEVFTSPAAYRDMSERGVMNKPDAVLLDLLFPKEDESGLAFLREMKSTAHKDIPIIVLSIEQSIEVRLAALRAGANRYLTKPLAAPKLLLVLDEVTQRRPEEDYRVLLVDDDDALLAYQQDLLEAAGFKVRALSQPLTTLDEMADFLPDVVVLDIYMPGASGLELAAIIRERETGIQTPILFLSAERDISQQLQALSLGGDDFLVKPVNPDRLINAITVRARRYRQQKNLQAHLDSERYEREREHRALNDHAIVSVADGRGRIIRLNDKFCEVSGYSSEELYGQDHRIVNSGVHSKAFFREMWQTITSGKTWRGEICNHSKDGTPYWVDSTITPFMDAQGKPYQFVSIRTDITPQKRMLAALEQSERDYRDLTANLPGIVYRSAVGVAPAMTLNSEAICGYTRDDLESGLVLWRDRVHPDDQEQRDAVIARLRALSDTAVLEYRIRHKDGRWIWVRDHMRSIFSNDDVFETIDGVIFDITDRKRAEEQLNETATLLDSVIENVPTMIFLKRATDLSFAMINRAGEQLLGIKREDLLDRTDYDFFPRAQADHFTAADRETLTSGKETYTPEETVATRNGNRVLSTRKIALKNRQGEAEYLLGISLDITDYARSKAEVEDARERLSRAQSFAGIGTWGYDLNSGDLFLSDHAAPVFGLPDGEIWMSWGEFASLVYPEDLPGLEQAMAALLDDTQPHTSEHRIVLPDGNLRWVRATGAVVESGATGRSVLGVIQNIDEQKRAELALRKSEEGLKEAQRVAQLGGWEMDLATGDEVWSEELYHIVGVDMDHYAPNIGAVDEYVHPDDVPLHQKALDYVLETGTEYEIEYRILRDDGVERTVREIGRPITNAQGEITKISGSVQDVTQEIEARTELIEARRLADQANQAKSEFLSNMSHELRTPMNAIIGFSQLLEYDDDLSEDQRESVLEIRKAGGHLLTLINEVLDLAKVESGKADIHMTVCDLQPLMQDCIALVKPLAAERHIELTLNDIGDIWVRSDPMRLKQVMLNLLSNGIKYNKEDGYVRLDVSTVAEGRVVISIQDSGIGIPAEKAGDLFQPFNRLNRDHDGIEGTGIGLSLTKRLVEQMDGTIGFDSVEGVGSTFWIDIPAAISDASEGGAVGIPADDDLERAHIDADAPTGSDEPFVILYIEDNPANLALVSRCLDGYADVELKAAHTGGLGVELARSLRPDLVLLDINLPDMDGYEVLEHLQSDAGTSEIPVVAVSANAMPSDIARGEQAAFDVYLTKPLDIKRFLTVIDTYLAKRP